MILQKMFMFALESKNSCMPQRTLKANYRFQGREKVQEQALMTAIAQNIKKIDNHLSEFQSRFG